MRALSLITSALLFHAALAFGQQEAIPRSIKDVRALSPDWICAVVDPTEEILAARQAQFGDDLAADKKIGEGEVAAGKDDWRFQFSKTYRTLVEQKEYHQPLFAKFNETDFWKVNGAAPTDVTVWAHAVDAFPGMDTNDFPACDVTLFFRTADMVYLKLPGALKNGEKVEVKGADGRAGSLTFQDESTPCWSIKVNQSAYASVAKKKAAYLGMWLPGIGALDFAAFEGKPFYLKKFEKGARWDKGTATGAPAFAGQIKLRKKFAEQDVVREGGSNMTGEDVYEMDFSEFAGEGTYCIQIPGLGRSWPFQVTTDGYGEAFYTMMKGLYIQRCGTELKKPFTAWERPACHTDTKQGQFIPETNNWYAEFVYTPKYRIGAENQNDVGFRDAAGQRIGVAHFTLIANSNPDSPTMPGVNGGWHDAADFDRRIHHYGVIWDLLAAAEAFPANFKDGQLNIPESGNGIPDILDEAAWGVDVWKKTQRADGAVCSWIEQDSHPGRKPTMEGAFLTNQQQMFAAIPDRTSSYAYAAAAACLGRLLAPYSPERSKEYIESAIKAYAWAKDENHAMKDCQFAIEIAPREPKLKGTTVRFDEDPKMITEDPGYIAGAFAAANLFFATKEAPYLQDWEASEVGKKYAGLSHLITPSMCMPILLNAELFPEKVEAVKKSLLEAADKFVAAQDSYAYRTLWLAPTEGWFHTMAWGNIYAKARMLAIAYAVTKDPKYKTAMENAADFFLGCNPTGTTSVTGIGSVYPLVIQHIHSLSDGIPDPTPGIAPYTFTYDVPFRNPFLIADRGHSSVKSFFQPIALAFVPDKLGRKELQANLDSIEKNPDSDAWVAPAGKPTRDIVWKNMPIFRRKVTHPTAVVPKNEFTVNETMSPLAMLFAALTGENYMPSEELKNREPKKTIEDLPVYSQP
jgi:hypothetical protein